MKTLKRRKHKGKTDYAKRIKLLKSGKPRVVFRKTNRYLIAQYVESHEAKDKVMLTVNSRDLLKSGWPKDFSGSLKSIPAAYLTGFLLGKKIKDKKLGIPILDTGMMRVLGKTKVFGFIKGIVDSGVEIKCDKENFPEEERIEGKNLKKDFSNEFKKIKSSIK